MDTTTANYEIYETLFTLFLTLYVSLLAVIVSEFCEGKWLGRKKKTVAGKDAGAGPEAKVGTPPSRATKDDN